MNMQALNPEDFLRVSLKRKWWILASVVVCVALAYVAWKYFPKTFKSTVIMTIDSPRIAKEYVKGLGQEARYGEDLAAIIVQQITLALTNESILMPVLETLKPYPDAERASSAQLMKRLRKSASKNIPASCCCPSKRFSWKNLEHRFSPLPKTKQKKIRSKPDLTMVLPLKFLKVFRPMCP